MIALGLQPRETVCILGFNSREWLIADLAAILAGGFAAGIYATNGADAVGYVLRHSRARLCVVENARQKAKVAAGASALMTSTA